MPNDRQLGNSGPRSAPGSVPPNGSTSSLDSCDSCGGSPNPYLLLPGQLGEAAGTPAAAHQTLQNSVAVAGAAAAGALAAPSRPRSVKQLSSAKPGAVDSCPRSTSNGPNVFAAVASQPDGSANAGASPYASFTSAVGEAPSPYASFTSLASGPSLTDAANPYAALTAADSSISGPPTPAAANPYAMFCADSTPMGSSPLQPSVQRAANPYEAFSGASTPMGSSPPNPALAQAANPYEMFSAASMPLAVPPATPPAAPASPSPPAANPYEMFSTASTPTGSLSSPGTSFTTPAGSAAPSEAETANLQRFRENQEAEESMRDLSRAAAQYKAARRASGSPRSTGDGSANPFNNVPDDGGWGPPGGSRSQPLVGAHPDATLHADASHKASKILNNRPSLHVGTLNVDSQLKTHLEVSHSTPMAPPAGCNAKVGEAAHGQHLARQPPAIQRLAITHEQHQPRLHILTAQQVPM